MKFTDRSVISTIAEWLLHVGRTLVKRLPDKRRQLGSNVLQPKSQFLGLLDVELVQLVAGQCLVYRAVVHLFGFALFGFLF